MSDEDVSNQQMEALQMLRQRRKERAERELGKVSRQLQETTLKFNQAQQQWEEADAEHHTQRATLSASYQDEAMSIGQLRDWQRQEQTLIEGVSRHHQAVEGLREQRDDQQARLDSYRQQLKKRQLGLEKLHEMRRLMMQGG